MYIFDFLSISCIYLEIADSALEGGGIWDKSKILGERTMGEYTLLVALGVIALVVIAFHIQMRRQERDRS